jgi:hypothetical protein
LNAALRLKHLARMVVLVALVSGGHLACGASIDVPAAAGVAFQRAQMVMAGQRIAVVIPVAATNSSSTTIVVNLFEIENDGIRQLASKALEGGWQASVAMDEQTLYVGLPIATSAGDKSDVAITERGSAPWSQERAVAFAGSVAALRISSNGFSEPIKVKTPEARSFARFGSNISVAGRYVAISAPGTTGKGTVYLFDKNALESKPVRIFSSNEKVTLRSAQALRLDELLVAGLTADQAVIATYRLTGPSQTLLKAPTPDSRLLFANEIAVNGRTMMVLSYGGGRGDGEAGAPWVDLFTLTDSGWRSSRHIELAEATLRPLPSGALNVAALAGDNLFVAVQGGVELWSQRNGDWQQATQKVMVLEPDAQAVALSAQGSRLAVLVQKRDVANGSSLSLRVQLVNQGRRND